MHRRAKRGAPRRSPGGKEGIGGAKLLQSELRVHPVGSIERPPLPNTLTGLGGRGPAEDWRWEKAVWNLNVYAVYTQDNGNVAGRTEHLLSFLDVLTSTNFNE